MATNKQNKKATTPATNNEVVITTTGTEGLLVNEDKQVLEGELMLDVSNDTMSEQDDDDALNALLGDAVAVEETDDEQPQKEPTMAEMMAIIQAQQEIINKLTARQLDARPVNTIKGVLLSGNNSATKADLARLIWDDEMTKHDMTCPQRGHTINRLCDEAGLTKAGAATYYQNMKKKAGFVNSK